MIARRRWMLAQLGLLLPWTAGAAAEALSFPRDFGSHPGAALEWWYLTGLLGSSEGSEPLFGYQLTFFRIKGPADEGHPSALAARQILLGHAALSDLRAGRLQHEQRVARAGLGLAEASESDCAVHIRDWSLRRTAAGYVAALRATGFSLDLQLRTTQPLLLQGDQGLSRKGPRPEQWSRYYSQVQLQTAATLRREDREQTLQGRSWLDHEWSEQQMLGTTAEAGRDRAVGWDWAGINLSDGGALTIFQLRRADGSRLWAGGSWRRADGRTMVFTPEQLRMRPLRQWRSPTSGAAYPVEWALETPLGELRLAALIDAQEIDARGSTGIRYWEGAAALKGPDGRLIGRGYLELTGYAGALTF